MPLHFAKLAEALLMPVAAACVLLAVGLMLSWARPRTSRCMIAAGAALLWGFGTPSVVEKLAAPLERAHPAPPATLRAEAAVVLTGTVDLSRSTPERIEFGDRVERIVEGAKLVKEGRARWLVITGGSGDPAWPEVREADLLARFASDYGVPASSILVERESRTTAENAACTSRLLKERDIRTAFLVTSAFHMPRSVACFRKAGINAIPYPVDFRAVPPKPQFAAYVPNVGALYLSTTLLHEYLGYAVYWVGGRV